jgi:hypothetical protein
VRHRPGARQARAKWSLRELLSARSVVGLASGLEEA